MRRRRLIWVAVLASFVGAHLPAPPVEAGGYRRHILLDGAQFPDTLIILVDNSASMRDDPYAAAVRSAVWITEQAGDSGRVRFATFGSEVVWQKPASEWTKLPDLEAVAIAKAWLLSRGTGGNTGLAEAVEEALRLGESPIGIAIISDCDPDGGTEQTRARIAAANARRKEPAVIGVVSIGPDAHAKKFALMVAGEAGGPAVELQAKTDEDGRGAKK